MARYTVPPAADIDGVSRCLKPLRGPFLDALMANHLVPAVYGERLDEAIKFGRV